jgi:DNA-binding NarL/FixJ family response regulator
MRVTEGCKNREIADSLGTAEHVVKNCLRLIDAASGSQPPIQ